MLRCERCPAVFHYPCSGYYDEKGTLLATPRMDLQVLAVLRLDLAVTEVTVFHNRRVHRAGNALHTLLPTVCLLNAIDSSRPMCTCCAVHMLSNMRADARK
jgi:hypothetical protein